MHLSLLRLGVLAAALASTPRVGAARSHPHGRARGPEPRAAHQDHGHVGLAARGALVEAPASIFVITPTTSGAPARLTLPEALRLAPNLHVARADTTSTRSPRAASTTRSPTSCWC
jgi:hypothetical protein